MSYNREELYKRTIHLYLEANPNPNSLKFVVNFMLFPEGESFDFPDPSAAENSPFATEWFKLKGVNRVFFMSNFVTITKSEAVEWDDIRDSLKDFIREYLEADKPLFNEDPLQQEQSDDSEEVLKIKSILDEYIKPAVEQDGGAIVFDSFEDGIVKVQLQGSCSGCPSSTVTLKAGIENLLKSMMPEVQAVEAESV